jgi:proline iminopeptidase
VRRSRFACRGAIEVLADGTDNQIYRLGDDMVVRLPRVPGAAEAVSKEQYWLPRHGRLIEAYAQLMRHPDPATRDAASLAWVDWEDHHISIGTGGVHRNPRWDDEEFRHVFATLVTHYWAHDGFLAPSILEQMDRLAGVPGTLIHGRRDVSGPAVIPWRLHQAWPGSELIIEEGEGHGGNAMVAAWCTANTRHADRISSDTG